MSRPTHDRVELALQASMLARELPHRNPDNHLDVLADEVLVLRSESETRRLLMANLTQSLLATDVKLDRVRALVSQARRAKLANVDTAELADALGML